MICVFFKVSSEKGTPRIYRNFYSPCRCALCRVLNSLNSYIARSIARHERGMYSVSVEASVRESTLRSPTIEGRMMRKHYMADVWERDHNELMVVAPELVELDDWTIGEYMLNVENNIMLVTNPTSVVKSRGLDS